MGNKMKTLDVPEVELLSFDTYLPKFPEWLEQSPLPNIYRDKLLEDIQCIIEQIDSLDAQDNKYREQKMGKYGISNIQYSTITRESNRISRNTRFRITESNTRVTNPIIQKDNCEICEKS